MLTSISYPVRLIPSARLNTQSPLLLSPFIVAIIIWLFDDQRAVCGVSQCGGCWTDWLMPKISKTFLPDSSFCGLCLTTVCSPTTAAAAAASKAERFSKVVVDFLTELEDILFLLYPSSFCVQTLFRLITTSLLTLSADQIVSVRLCCSCFCVFLSGVAPVCVYVLSFQRELCNSSPLTLFTLGLVYCCCWWCWWCCQSALKKKKIRKKV